MTVIEIFIFRLQFIASMNFRSKYLIINNNARTVGGSNTDFVVNFSNTPFVGKQVYKITPKFIRFPNTLFNVFKGYNDVVIVHGKINNVEQSHKSITFPAGFYTSDTWITEYNNLLNGHLNISWPKLKVTHDKNNILTLEPLHPAAGQEIHLTVPALDTERHNSPVFDMLGIKSQHYAADLKQNSFEMKADVGDFHLCESAACFNWNDAMYVETNFSHSNSVEASGKINSLFDVVPIEPNSLRGQIHHYVNRVENAGSIYLKDGNTVQNIHIHLKTANGLTQQTFENFEFIMVLRFYYNMS